MFSSTAAPRASALRYSAQSSLVGSPANCSRKNLPIGDSTMIAVIAAVESDATKK